MPGLDTRGRVRLANNDGVRLPSGQLPALNEAMPARVQRDEQRLFMGDDLFPLKPCLIRNTEMDNTLAYASGTPITVSSATSTKLTMSWVPFIDTLFNPRPGKEWVLTFPASHSGTDPSRSGDYRVWLKITGGTYSTKVLDYTEVRDDASWNSGDYVSKNVIFLNPFEAGWDIHETYLIGTKTSTYRSTYLSPAGIFKRTDGKWCLLVNGYNGSEFQIGAFISSDLEHWDELAGSPFFTKGGSGWRADNIYISSTVLPSRLDDRLIAYMNGYKSADSKWRIGYVKFDEDLTSASIEYSANHIFGTEPTGAAGYYANSVIRYGNRHRMIFQNRTNANPDVSAWEIWEAYSDSELGPFDYVVGTTDPVIATVYTNDGSFRSSHSDAFGMFMYKGRLYMIVAGTSRYKESGNKANRVYGLFYLDERAGGAWREDTRSPLLIHPDRANSNFWSAFETWADDHCGGYPVVIYDEENEKLHLLYTMTSGSNNYKMARATLDLATLGV